MYVNNVEDISKHIFVHIHADTYIWDIYMLTCIYMKIYLYMYKVRF